MRKKTAIVTGGAGFIGSHMTDFLIKKEYKVVVIDNLSGGKIENIKHHFKKKNFLFLKKDVCDVLVDLKKKLKKVDYFFHFAGKGDIVPSIQQPFEYFYHNVMGTINMLQLARKLRVKKFVYAASSSCYGLAKTPTSEKNKINPLYPYALSKFMGEEAALHWQKVYGVRVNSIRIFNAYGPRVSTKGSYGAVFGVFLRQKLSNLPFTLVGDGKQKRDFVYVSDVVNAFYLAAKNIKSGQIYNLGSGNPQSIKELISIIKGKYVNLPKRPGEPNSTHANISKIKKELKWRPKIKFKDGVKIMLENINDWKNSPVWNKKKIKIATKEWFKFMGKKSLIKD
jgi:UDP-glucose 4-epimerase